MFQRKQLACFGLLASTLASAASAQDLMIVESTTDRVMLFSAADGTLINDTFIDLTTATPSPSTPVEAIEVGNEIWISDQIADTVFRYSADGTTFLGTATTGRDNMRGIALANGSVYVTNSGTGGAAYGDVLKEYATDGTLLNTHPVGDPFDVIDYGGSLLIANIAGEDIEEYAYDGTFIGIFHDSDGITGIDFPEQLAAVGNGNVLAAGFSAPSGIYEYDSTGAQINFYDPGNSGLRGVALLDNGDIIYTTGSGVFTYNIASGLSTQTHAGVSGRFITRVGGNISSGMAYCFGDGSGATCPCGNVGGAGEGCSNSAGVGSTLTGSGNASLSNDTLQMDVVGVPGAKPGLIIRGNNQIANLAGDGLLCAGGGSMRSQVQVTVAGATSFTDFNGGPFGTVANIGTPTNFQFWYRDPQSGPCGTGFNFSNGWTVTYTP